MNAQQKRVVKKYSCAIPQTKKHKDASKDFEHINRTFDELIKDYKDPEIPSGLRAVTLKVIKRKRKSFEVWRDVHSTSYMFPELRKIARDKMFNLAKTKEELRISLITFEVKSEKRKALQEKIEKL